MKLCSKCKIEKPKLGFSRNKNTRDGLDGTCKSCTSARSANHYSKNKSRRKLQMLEWVGKNRSKLSGYCKKWRDANPGEQARLSKMWYDKNREKALASDKASREANIEKFLQRERESYTRYRIQRAERRAKWAAKNPDKICEYAASRRSAKSNRTPPWLTSAHFEEILSFYSAAAQLSRLMGGEYHVDHIVPLRGKRVSGLHVPWNLQILTKNENLRKTNHYEP